MSINLDLAPDLDIISLDDLHEAEQGGVAEPASAFERAGFDPLTPVDTFLRMQGSAAFVTGGHDDFE